MSRSRVRPGRSLAGCALALAVACAACSSAPAGDASPSRAAAPASSTGSPDGAGGGASSSPRPAPRSCAARVYGRMTEAQRVGQLFIVGLPRDRLSAATARAITGYHFGSVQFITTSTAGVAGIRPVTSATQHLASARATAGARYFIAANQEGGEVQALQGPGFAAIPAATGQGLMPPAALRRSAVGWGRELRAAGVNLNFAPVMDTVPAGSENLNQPIGVLHREFGQDPATVAAHGVAFIRGMTKAGVSVTAKHFPGLGRVAGNTDFSSGVTDSVTTRDDAYLRPFRAAAGAGVPFVMVALARYTRIDPGRLAVFSSAVMRGMLRQRLGFRGVIVSDDLGAAVAVAEVAPGQRATRFLAAGGDLITSKYPGPAMAMARAVLARARASGGFQRTVSSAVMHVLAAKQAAGLLPCRGR